MQKTCIILAYFHGVSDDEDYANIIQFSKNYKGTELFTSNNTQAWVYITDELEEKIEEDWESSNFTPTLNCETQSHDWISCFEQQIKNSITTIKNNIKYEFRNISQKR